MIERDWNRPSIVIWGVRINEVAGQPRLLYRDQPPRPRTRPDAADRGVRYITDSELLEDVYTMNDFGLGSEELPGANRGRVPRCGRGPRSPVSPVRCPT